MRVFHASIDCSKFILREPLVLATMSQSLPKHIIIITLLSGVKTLGCLPQNGQSLSSFISAAQSSAHTTNALLVPI